MITIYLRRKAISAYLFQKTGIITSSKTIGYFAVALIVVLSIAGVLLSNTKDKYSQLASGQSSQKSVSNTKVFDQKDKDKPHRWFDINFDIFK
jgi:hypothetical protein